MARHRGSWRSGAATHGPWGAAPLREELFGPERLEGHGRSLALAHGAGSLGRGKGLRRRLAENEALLISAYKDTMAAVDEGETITPAAEWLIDNFALVEKQIREIALDLPQDYYRALPKVAQGHLAGYPRVFALAWAYVAHTDSRFDPDLLRRFLRAYQEVEPLTIGELWAVAITLKVTLVENLRRLSVQLVADRRSRAAADGFCDQLLEEEEARADAPRVWPRMTPDDVFAVQVRQRLRDGGPAAARALTWLDERLEARMARIEDIVPREQHRQVAAGASVRNIVASMRLVSDIDWAEFVESVSLVDEVLKTGSTFAALDFSTRNLYRGAVEALARGSGLREIDVAHRVMTLVRQVDDLTGEGRRCEPGHHLIGAGRPAFERAIGYRPRIIDAPARMIRRFGLAAYGAAIALLAAFALVLTLGLVSWLGDGGVAIALLALVGLLPATEAAVALVNAGVTGGVRAKPLPALELKAGVPQRLRTLIAAPVLLTSEAEARAQVERLETHFLAGPEGHVHLALLSDWRDAETPTLESDEAILEAARQAIVALNQKYGPTSGGDRFLLLHRRRAWCQTQQCWMGWERKRGKLHELNRLLRGDDKTTFIPIEGQVLPDGVRYVVTVDADTRLPREAVRRLIGKIAHPLNAPHYDPALGRVTEGHAILQPRVTPALPAGETTLFRRVFSSLGGIDPYAAAVSDVYQDLFGEGSYTGKGVYHIDAFEAALRDRAPEEALLSHDLFEGVFARAGLASDIEVVEDFPDRYDVAAARHHRWTRGDWQLLPWILNLAPKPGAARTRDLPAVGRWKMIDNLRRTLSPMSALVSLLIGWLQPALPALVWTVFMAWAVLTPALIPVIVSLRRRRVGVPMRIRLRSALGDLRLSAAQAGLAIAFLADQTWLMADAVGRTLWRLFVSRRGLLEWTPAAQAAATMKLQRASFVRRMAPGAILGALVLLALSLAASLGHGVGGALVGAPFALAWLLAPEIAFRISRRGPPAPEAAPTAEAMAQFGAIGRQTFRFFETFVTAADHHLPPDNFQEDPQALARRTSPTNIGLYVISLIAAHDQGWIGRQAALRRLAATTDTLLKLQRCRGHFYNWYDTETLAPLEPVYVSSVDSGNLAGHLVAAAAALDEWAGAPPDPATGLTGAQDALAVLTQTVGDLAATPEGLAVGIENLRRSLAAAIARAAATPEQIGRLMLEAESVRRTVEEWLDPARNDLLHWIAAIHGSLAAALDADEDRGERTSEKAAPVDPLSLAATWRRLAWEHDFTFLFDPDRHLLSIGARPSGERDPTCYDLLGSEARLASFLAIAKGDVQPRHWFRLSHAVTPAAQGAVLVSWSGSMFEHLMPSLIMQEPPGSVLAASNRLVVAAQQAYGARLGVPWGMSEAAFAARDLNLVYQYQAFGVPSLGLKRGLDESVVVAPYATALAAMIDAPAAAANFDRLAALGVRGRYGFIESLDYTPGRIAEGAAFTPVRAFMAHHQGMTIVALFNARRGGRMRERFHRDPRVRATELLLQERMPREVVISQPEIAHRAKTQKAVDMVTPGMRRVSGAHTARPITHLLSNGRYAVMTSTAGGGYATWRGLAINRWREDATRDAHGAFIYLRDVASGAVWSSGLQPTLAEPDEYWSILSEDHAEIHRRDGDILCRTDLYVSAEDDGEVRRVTLTNKGSAVREIELTSYVELALAPPAADRAHPAFSKLFIETEHLPGSGALLATRRRRAPDEPEVWVAHLAVVQGEQVARAQFETDRTAFLGRGGDVAAPDGLDRPLSGASGAVLDPMLGLRRCVRLPAGASVKVAFWTLVASSRREVLDLLDKHGEPSAFDRAANLAWTHALVQLRHLDTSRGEAALFQRLAAHLVFAGRRLRRPATTLSQVAEGQPGLWRIGLSGDAPIVVGVVEGLEGLAFARQLVKACQYWRSKQLTFNLVLVNAQATSYVQDLQNALEALVRGVQVHSDANAGRAMVLRGEMVAPETLALLRASARIVLTSKDGSLAEQVERLGAEATERPLRPARPAEGFAPPPKAELEFDNGLGGFADDGKTYVVRLGPGQATPAPWINVIANPVFGFQVSAHGAGFAWRHNSREHPLTPWSNDAALEQASEAFFLKDLESQAVWTPTASPIRLEEATYEARHGRGSSRFTLTAHDIDSELLQFAAADDPVKISRLRLRNRTSRTRRLSITAYAEWALGQSRELTGPHIFTWRDAGSGALMAAHRWDPREGQATAFCALDAAVESWTTDRRTFLGRNGGLSAPAALAEDGSLGEAFGMGLDPCAVQRTILTLAPGQTADVVCLLGEADDPAAATALVDHWRERDLEAALAEVEARWAVLLDQAQVRTPDRAMDLMLNGWLLYQTVSSRLWGRAGFYQASGAYGFRDQLQDVMALTGSRPDIAREHILRAAARQFVEGDVQHWWLPRSGQGVRTRITDDRLWLAYTTAHYVATTQDRGVLDATASFLGGPTLASEEHERFSAPPVVGEASLYEHCARAIDASLEMGGHGLPLIGTGDWNDGFNRVGERGLGESVWLGWFLYAVLDDFTPLAQARGDAVRAKTWVARQKALAAALERHGWDGAWYRRGWYDNGAPLGSAASDECRIDAIAQSWAVISGAGDPDRAEQAMAALQRDLILPGEGLALLFSPPFAHTAHDPGYIKAYPPGVRENGGQYTHAAAWTVIALAKLDRADEAQALLAMLNPVGRTASAAGIARYKVEPYVSAADVYAAPGWVGRGGWTWYTGSAAWLQRAGIEAILGLRRRGERLLIDPRLPKVWPGFSVTLAFGASRYEIEVIRGADASSAGATLDGGALEVDVRRDGLHLRDDGQVHHVRIIMPGAPPVQKGRAVDVAQNHPVGAAPSSTP